MLFPTISLTFFVIVSLLVRNIDAYAVPLLARSLSGFAFPTIHVGPVPTPTGRIESGTGKTPFFTTHITKTVVVQFSTSSTSPERSLTGIGTDT